MNHTITLLYFGALGEHLGLREETFVLPQHTWTLAQLRHHLLARGEPWQALNASNLRTAANHAIVTEDYAVSAGDEIAFFPPVTGG